jgi:hypothetical protein
MLALGEVDQAAELVEILARGFLQHHRATALQSQSRQAQVLEDLALHDHAVERFA